MTEWIGSYNGFSMLWVFMLHIWGFRLFILKRHCLYSLILLQRIACTECMGLKEGAQTVRFILGRWVEAVGMCLREGDNVATRNPTSSAENRHSSISLQQSGSSVQVVSFTASISSNISAASQQQSPVAESNLVHSGGGIRTRSSPALTHAGTKC